MTANQVLEARNQRLRWERTQNKPKRSLYFPKGHPQKTFDDIQYIYTKEVIQQMNLKQLANTKTIGNVTDLAQIPVDVEVFEKTETTKEGKQYLNTYIEITGKKYRIPQSVLTEIGKFTDEIKNFKVTKTGKGMETRYNVEAV